MSQEKIQQLSAATRSPAVALMKFNKLRSKHRNGMVFAFEGQEDPIFYAMAAQRLDFTQTFHPLVLNGKDMVLGLRALLTNSMEADKGEGVAFFIDSDFDGLKGHAAGPDIYVTPTYSIENIVCSVSSLKSLLRFEFKLYEDDLEDDIDKICTYYQNTLNSFQLEMRDVNLLIYFGRKFSQRMLNSKIISINDQLDKYFTLNANTLTISSNCKGNAAKNQVRFDCDFDFSETNIASNEFDKLDPQTSWRGKFIFHMFTKFIQAIAEDRNLQQPKFFRKGKGKVKLNLATDTSYRVLTTACELPQCLKHFLMALPAKALR